MKRRIPCLLPGIVARAIINSPTANYDVISCASLSDMPNYRHDKIANLMRSEVGMLSRMSERKEALARCIRPYIKTK
jgi:hypothetical protein